MRILFWVFLAGLTACMPAMETDAAPSSGDGSRYAYCETDGFTINNGVLKYCGRFEGGTAAKFRSHLNAADIDRVEINSQGGISSEAIMIAKALQESGTPLLVTGRCVSSCAHFILMTVDDVTVAPDTLVAFHRTSVGTAAMLYQNEYLKLDNAAQDYMDLISMEREFYDEAGLDIKFLLEPLWRIEPTCFVKLLYDSSGQIEGSRMKSKIWFWTPSRTFVDTVRRSPIKGWWPTELEEWQALVQKRRPTVDPRRYAFQTESDTAFASASSYPLPQCES